MPYGTPPLARQPEHRRFNRFLASLPPHDFSWLAPHLRPSHTTGRTGAYPVVRWIMWCGGCDGNLAE